MTGFNKHKKANWQYPSLDSAIRPVAHSEDLPVPVFTSLPEIDETEEIPADLSIISNTPLFSLLSSSLNVALILPLIFGFLK